MIEQIIHRITCWSGQVHLLVEMMRIVLQEKIIWVQKDPSVFTDEAVFEAVQNSFFFISKVVVEFPVQLWLDSSIMGDCFADWDQRCFFVLEVSLLCVCAVDRGGWFYFQGLLLWTLVLSLPEELCWLRALDALDCKLLVDIRLDIWPAVNTHTCKQYWGVPKWWDRAKLWVQLSIGDHFYMLLYFDSWLQSAWWVNFLEKKYGISIRKDGLTPHTPHFVISTYETGLQLIVSPPPISSYSFL